MTVTLKQLEVFHAIVVAGSISKTTRALGLSQPTISQQLAKLEDKLGTQLIHRGRSETLRLTSAGEYWYKIAGRILGAIDEAEQEHRTLFDEKRLTLHFGTTPSLRGRFLEVAAQTALEIRQFSRFDFDWALTSSEIVEMINTRRINCGVVSAASVEDQKSSLYVEHLCRDKIVWTVPVSIPDEVIAEVLATGQPPEASHDALTRFVDVTPVIPWRERSENWYRTILPFASPFFGCVTHQAAVDIVAAGLATCHTPMSLLPNLPNQVRKRIKIYDLDEYGRDVVLVMPKHLLSLKPFATFRERISDYVRTTYELTRADIEVRPIPGQKRQPPQAAE
jgi:DNA-binding transcriptional LysR family regulator